MSIQNSRIKARFVSRVWVALDRLLVLASSPKPQEPGFVASWLAPTALARARVMERAGRVDGMMRVMVALTVGVLVWCVVSLGAWAVVPLVAMLVALALGPIAVRRGGRVLARLPAAVARVGG